LRDYLPVEEVAARLVALLEHPSFDGVVNICSGQPISVRRLVEEHVVAVGGSIWFNFGHYPYPDYEPMAFWGDAQRCLSLCRSHPPAVKSNLRTVSEDESFAGKPFIKENER